MRQLPSTSRLHQAVNGCEGYTLERELMHSVMDLLHLQLQQNSGRKSTHTPFPRPWQAAAQAQEEAATVIALRAWKERHKEALNAG